MTRTERSEIENRFERDFQNKFDSIIIITNIIIHHSLARISLLSFPFRSNASNSCYEY